MKSSQPVSMLRLPRLSLVVNCIKVGGLAALAGPQLGPQLGGQRNNGMLRKCLSLPWSASGH